MGSIQQAANDYLHLDQSDFQKLYLSSQNRTFRLQVKGVGCSKCIQKVEGLQASLNEVESIRLNLGSGEARVQFFPQIKNPQLSLVMAKVASIGYQPIALLANASDEEMQKQADRSDLIRLGVAISISSNIMMFAIAQYAGATGLEDRFFSWFSFLLMIPYMGYVAIPFYQGCLKSFKQRALSVDAPLTLALVTGFLFSSFNLWQGSGSLYFDSLTSFTTLILLSRFAQKKLQKSFTNEDAMSGFSLAEKIEKVSKDGLVEFIPAGELKTGDVFYLNGGQFAPSDCELLSDKAELDFQLTTGESEPQLFSKGMIVPHGCKIVSKRALVRLTVLAKETSFGQFLQTLQIAKVQRAKLFLLSEKFAQYLVSSVFAIAAVVFAHFTLQGELIVGLERSLALLIVACPCALAFGTPLAISFALKRARKFGIFIKSADVLENLSRVNQAFFDKTGTLTQASLKVLRTEPEQLSPATLSLLLGLEKKSHHPIAFALRRHFASSNGVVPEVEFDWCEERPGLGVWGETKSGLKTHITSEPDETENEKVVTLFINDDPCAKIFLQAQTPVETEDLFALMQKRNIRIAILSGDSQKQVNTIGKKLGISDLRWQQSPEDKMQAVGAEPLSLFVGDGVNDALALKKAFVSVAVSGSLTEALKSADVYFTEPGLVSLKQLFLTSDLALTLMKRNLLISAVYNLSAGTAAILGFVNPLIAAVLMPISSGAMLLMTYLGARK
jgi:Cu+-exporting ATPase